MKSYKWGVIGPGNIAHDFANDLKLVTPTQSIEAVLSDHSESLEKFANEFHIEKRFLKIDDFIKNSGVDIVYVATPHPFHFAAIKKCLKNKISVLCEKPIVINHAQFKVIETLALKHNVFLMEGMWIRFLPPVKKLLELVSQKKIGKITGIKAAMAFKAPCDESNRFYDPEKGGGSLLDLGVYCVFLSTLLLGKPSKIEAVANVSQTGVDEACAMLLSYKRNSYAMLESSLQKNQDAPAEIFGTKGIIRILNPWFEKSPGIEVEMADGNKKQFLFEWDGKGLQYEIQEVIKCISHQQIESELLPHSLSKTTLQIMDIIRKQIGVIYPKYETKNVTEKISAKIEKLETKK